jgi:hypothetical protein
VTIWKLTKCGQWISRVIKFLKQKKDSGVMTSILSGGEAAKLITLATHEPYNVIGFDEIKAKRLGVQVCQAVTITLVDSSLHLSHQ